MAIYVVRHGETVDNAARVIQWPDSPLSERGREQARRLALRAAALGITRILASDYRRAAETARVVGDALGLAVEFDALLRERNLGDLRGTPYHALAVDPFAEGYAPPNGEGWPQFRARVASAWVRTVAAAAATRGNLLVVTHGLVCGVLAQRHLQIAPGCTVPMAWHNAGLTQVDGTEPWTVRLLNCAAHLDDLAPLARSGAA